MFYRNCNTNRGNRGEGEKEKNPARGTDDFSGSPCPSITSLTDPLIAARPEKVGKVEEKGGQVSEFDAL